MRSAPLFVLTVSLIACSSAPPESVPPKIPLPFDHTYLDRERVEHGETEPPEVFSELLFPTIGCPARGAPGGKLVAYLRGSVEATADRVFYLVPRDVIRKDIEALPYHLSPPEHPLLGLRRALDEHFRGDFVASSDEEELKGRVEAMRDLIRKAEKSLVDLPGQEAKGPLGELRRELIESQREILDWRDPVAAFLDAQLVQPGAPALAGPYEKARERFKVAVRRAKGAAANDDPRDRERAARSFRLAERQYRTSIKKASEAPGRPERKLLFEGTLQAESARVETVTHEVQALLEGEGGGLTLLLRQIARWRAALHELIWLERSEPEFQEQLEEIHCDSDTTAGAPDRIAALRERVIAHAKIVAEEKDAKKRRKKFAGSYELKRAGAQAVKADTTQVTLELPETVAPGLYCLVVYQEGYLLDSADVQFNAVYVPENPQEDFSFVVAADFQWGPRESVVRSCLRFIQETNASLELASGSDRPEFMIVMGDLVDCRYGSARSNVETIGTGAIAFRRDFYQAWLLLLTSELPVYVLPGNHDGYRLAPSLLPQRWLPYYGDGEDGLKLFEGTFGPRYAGFQRGAWRFHLLNSYDLPDTLRTIRPSGVFFWTLSPRKTRKFNWGGSIREAQYEWLKKRLAESPKERSLVFLHHDPRGAVPALKRPRSRAPWDMVRHLPPLREGLDAKEAPLLALRRGHNLRHPDAAWAPRSSETEELHGGFYTPFRTDETGIDSSNWFDTTAVKVFFDGGNSLPKARGYPGWSKWQQVWHWPMAYPTEGEIGESTALSNLEEGRPGSKGGLVWPGELLGLLTQGAVRGIFEGHDNLFARYEVQPGQPWRGILPKTQVEGLRACFPRDAKGEEAYLRFKKKLMVPRGSRFGVYRTADVADADSSGHGYLRVEIREGRMTVLEEDILSVARPSRDEDD